MANQRNKNGINTGIAWCDVTTNLWWGCSKVHTGCKNCYAETLSKRFGDDIWGEKNPRKQIKSAFNDLDKYQKQAEKANVKVKVFVGSMMDIFEAPKNIQNLNGVYPNTGSLRADLFNRILQGKYQNIVFLFLTKRPENIRSMIPFLWYDRFPSNVWIGVSISDQTTANEAIEIINKYAFPYNMFLSIEPQVGLIDEINLSGINWVIQGGESGHNKRPFNIEWAERMKVICEEQNTPYFFKQIDKVQPIPEHLNIKQYPEF